MAGRIRAGIVGFTGYSGAELTGLLRRHPCAEPVWLEHRRTSDNELPVFSNGVERAPFDPAAISEAKLDVVFLATPVEVSLEAAPAALEAGLKVIDLSGAYRLRTPELFKRWYGLEHPQPELLRQAAYGLPEFFRERIRDARLTANPGCYPTAANLALRPLIAEGAADLTAGVVCDAKSGVSGAGKKPSDRTHFCAVTDNFSTYSVMRHRHVPEVLLTSDLEEGDFSFTAQLLPVHRGILETIYLRTARSLDHDELLGIYRRQYGDEPFVRIYPRGRFPDLQAVAQTNFCDIGVEVDPASRRVTIVAAIDNLVKGAAGQAVQNMNLMFGFDETVGLL